MARDYNARTLDNIDLSSLRVKRVSRQFQKQKKFQVLCYFQKLTVFTPSPRLN